MGTQPTILMTTDSVGGVWTYACELIRSLQPYGYSTLLVVRGPMTSFQREVAHDLPKTRVFERSEKLEWMENPWSEINELGEWLLMLENSCHPNLIHLNEFSLAALPWHAPTLVIAHSCVFSWWLHVHGAASRPPPPWDLYHAKVKRGLMAAKRVVAPSRFMAETLQHIYDLPQPVHVISNGRQATPGRKPTKEPLIFSCGRIWDKAKNMHLLGLVSANLPWPVAIAGDCDAAPQFRNVIHLGKLTSNDVFNWMARASLFISPSLYEPFGLAVLEAALQGCALLLSDIPTFRELWTGAACFFDPSDSNALESAVRDIVENRERREFLAAAAYARARLYSPERMAEGYHRVFRDLIGDPIKPLKELA